MYVCMYVCMYVAISMRIDGLQGQSFISFSPHFLKYSTGNLSLPELKSSFSEALTGLLENNLPLCLGSVEKVCVLTYSPAADRYNMFWCL